MKLNIKIHLLKAKASILTCITLASLPWLQPQAEAAYTPVVPQGPVPTVRAMALDPEPGAAWFHADSDDFLPLPNHPPIDQIPPLPVPQTVDLAGLGQASDSCMVHDSIARQTWELPEPPLGLKALGGVGAQAKGYGGPDGGGDEGNHLATLGNMSRISNPAGHPWRMNCKIVMRFVDTSGVDRFFVASGAMIDAEVVLTAAHCVYNRASNINDWAREIWVYPGWDGNGNAFSPAGSVFENYGYARGTHFMAGSSYISSGTFNADVGLIRLTRAVGMITGWYGWSWGFGCETIQDRTYHNASFPAESCPTLGMHNGRDMYYWFGKIDSCPGNQLGIVTGGGNCLDTLWGGQSGSALYYKDGDSRYVHAVASNSDRDVSGRYAKLWETFVNDMNTSFIPGTRGATFDLQALNCSASPQTVQLGEQLTVNHLAVNPSNGSKSGQFVFRIYLSSNNNISSSDTLLGTRSYNRHFAGMSSALIQPDPVTIPANTPPGDYWIGVIYDNATDAVFGNNDTDEWDAVPVHVYHPPALNDHFSTPFVLNGWSGTDSGHNVGATKALDEADHAGNSGGSSVWWRWAAPADGTLQVDTFGSSFDTLLAVYATTTWGLSQAAANDDSGGPQSAVSFSVVAGVTYRIAVDGYNGLEGDITLHWLFTPTPPANDSFVDATIWPNALSSVVGKNFFATKEASEPNHAGNGGGKSVWWHWTAPMDGVVRMDTFGSDFDTLLAVYTGSSLNPPQTVASNDDTPPGRQSKVAFFAHAGTTYHVAVDGYGGADGHIALHFEQSAPPVIRLTAIQNGLIQLTLTGEPGESYLVEQTTDLVHWTPIATQTLTGQSLTFYSPTPVTAGGCTFYRAMAMP